MPRCSIPTIIIEYLLPARRHFHLATMDLSLMMKLLFIFTIISAVVSCVAVYFSRDNLLSPSELKAVRRSQTQNNKGAIPDIQHEPSYDESVLPSGDKELADKTGTVERSHYLPHALIIGVKKCGTGALQTFLDIHPGTVHIDSGKFST